MTEFSQEHRPYDTWWLNQLKCSTVVYVHNFFAVLGLSLTAGLSLWAHVDSYSWCWSIPLDYVGVGVSSGGCTCDFSLTANKVSMHKIFKYFYTITHKLISLISHAQPSLGVLMDLVFDPFLIHFSFVFVDIDHQKWSQKWTEKWDLWTWPPWNFQKWDQKWVKNGTTHFSAPWQLWTPQLVADSTLSYHFPNIICQPQIFLEPSLTIL